MISKLINRLISYAYKKELEKRVGKKLPNVIVKGKLFFESNNITIGDNVVLYPNVSFTGSGNIIIGDNCKIGKDCILYSSKNGGISIGHHSIIAAQTYIIDSNHSYSPNEYICDMPLVTDAVNIGENVWIGANCTIIKGSKIGNNTIIGAKSLVNKTIPDNVVAFGIPAKVVKYL